MKYDTSIWNGILLRICANQLHLKQLNYNKNKIYFTSVNTEAAVVHERQGTKTSGLGQFVAAKDAI